MIYDLDFEAVADVIAGASGPTTVILGKDAGSKLAELYSVVEVDDVSDIADLFATGRLGVAGEATLFVDVVEPSYVGPGEFAVVEGAFTSIAEAAATAGLEPIDTTACGTPAHITIDLLHSMMEVRTEIVAYVEISEGKAVYLPVTPDDVRNLFYGRHGAPTIRAYVNKRNQIVIGEPADVVAE